jgi:phosphatidate cytidylyltransferase
MINYELQNRILSSIIIVPIAIFFIFQGSIFFAFFLSIFFLACSYEWIKMNKKDNLKAIGIFYLFFASYYAYLLREKFSLGIFILILIICIFTDIGGYIFGKIFKGPKLTKISPKKTYAGAIGSFILSLIAAIIFTKYTNIGTLAHANLSLWTGNNLESDNMFFLFILFISFISQIGDLIISYFKRLAKVKDTGKLLPGHGGLLDRVDGIIFAIPTSYLLFNFLI